MPITPAKPTRNELKLLKYLCLSESDKVVIRFGKPPCFDIEIWKKDCASSEAFQIPIESMETDAPLDEDDLGLPMLPSNGSTMCSYPNAGLPRSARRIEARNLDVILLSSKRELESFGAQRLAKQKDDERRLERLGIENSGMSLLDFDRID